MLAVFDFVARTMFWFSKHMPADGRVTDDG